MLIARSELELIVNPRIRQRTFHLPVRRGKWGELRKCPAKQGCVYTLRANPEYQRYRAEAQHQASQRAGVLWLIDRVEVQGLGSVVVTVRSVELSDDGSSWLVGFSKGDQSELMDKPRLLMAHSGSPHGEYTNVAALALPGSAEEIPEVNQGRYARAADNARKTGLVDQRERLLELVSLIRLETARQNVGTSTARRRLKTVEHQVRALVREARRVA